MKSIKETFLLALKLELSTFKIKRRCSTCERYDTMLTSTPRSSVLIMENLSIIITSAHRRVNILIICKLIILIVEVRYLVMGYWVSAQYPKLTYVIYIYLPLTSNKDKSFLEFLVSFTWYQSLEILTLSCRPLLSFFSSL